MTRSPQIPSPFPLPGGEGMTGTILGVSKKIIKTSPITPSPLGRGKGEGHRRVVAYGMLLLQLISGLALQWLVTPINPAQATTVHSFAELVKVQPATRPVQSAKKTAPAAMPHPSGFYQAPEANTVTLAAKHYPGKPAATATTREGRLNLIQGKAKVITLPRAAVRVSVSDPRVAGVVVISPWQVQVIGKTRGLTNLMIWEEGQGGQFKTFDVLVQRDTSLLAEQIARIAPDVRVESMMARDTVILSGEVDSQEQAQIILTLAHAFFNGANTPVGGGGSGASTSGNGNGSGSGNAGASPAGGGASGSGVGASGMAGATSSPTGTGNASAIGASSASPGSSLLGHNNAVINLMHVKGMPSTKLEQVRQQLQAISPGIHLEVLTASDGVEKAVLTGRVATSGLIARALNLVSVYYGQPGIKVISGPGGNNIRGIGDNKFQDAQNFSNNLDTNLLQGLVLSDASGKVISLIEMDRKPQVRASIRILEVSHKATNLLGVPFSQINFGSNFVIQNDFTPVGAPAANRTGLAGLPGGTAGIRAGDLNITLQALEQKQLIRSLAEPTITTLSGEKGSFLAGGEVPIPISDTNGRITLQYKEFGIRLNMVSTVTDDGKINLQVAPEVSSIDPSLSFNSTTINIPGIRSRRMQTTVELIPGQSFVLAGLFSSADAEALSKFPGLGNIPILGALAKTNLRDKTDSELVVIIRPEIVTTADVATPSGTTGQ